MKTLGLFASSCLLLASACTTSVQTPANASKPTAATSTFALHQYRCESGAILVARYPSTDSATVQYKGRQYSMTISVSGSGARYVGGDLEWWTKGTGPGSQGMLLRHAADGKSGAVLESCKGL